MKSVPSCLIVDDNQSFLDVATGLLQQQGLTLVGSATNKDQALQLADEFSPDIILVDMMLGAESGIDLAGQLVELHPNSTVVLISTHAEADFAVLIDGSGAAGFIPKSRLSVSEIMRFVPGGSGS